MYGWSNYAWNSYKSEPDIFSLDNVVHCKFPKIYIFPTILVRKGGLRVVWYLPLQNEKYTPYPEKYSTTVYTGTRTLLLLSIYLRFKLKHGAKIDFNIKKSLFNCTKQSWPRPVVKSRLHCIQQYVTDSWGWIRNRWNLFIKYCKFPN